MIEDDGPWQFAIDTPLPLVTITGRGTCLAVSGWCFHRHSPMAGVALSLAGRAQPAIVHSMPRMDVYARWASAADRPADATYLSGFWGLVPVEPVSERIGTWLRIALRAHSGETLERKVAHLTLIGATPAHAPAVPGGDLVAICMAT